MNGQGQVHVMWEICGQAVSAVVGLAFLVVSALLLIVPAYAQTFSVIHTFVGSASGDGANPVSGPIVGPTGTIYGTTDAGGTCGGGGCGTVYKTSPTGKYSVIASLPTVALSASNDPPLLDGKGNIYGASSDFFDNWGELYEVKDGNAFAVYAFQGGPDGGLVFNNTLSLGPRGIIYAPTVGVPFGSPCEAGKYLCGTLFKFDPKTSNLTTLHVFGQGSDGFNPEQGMLQSPSGTFYGTTACGGAHNQGAIYELTSTDKYKQLYSFSTPYNGCPTSTSNGGPSGSGTMALDDHGNLYGATAYDGSSGGHGMVFRFNIASRKLKVLHTFTHGSDGAVPDAGVVLDKNGNLYGVAGYGGSGYGTVFEVSKAGKYKVLYTFTGGSDGNDPVGITIDAAGNLWGATYEGGDSTCNCGTEFKITF
jgi:uncharacterized repeat protein (TIGR03803 family)